MAQGTEGTGARAEKTSTFFPVKQPFANWNSPL
jgi:hypothetical protein